MKKSKKIGPLNTESDDDTDEEGLIVEGVYKVSLSWGEVGLSPYVFAHHANHVIITETASTSWELDRRVAVHLLAIDEVLKHHHPE